jgi:hypothetical protein
MTRLLTCLLIIFALAIGCSKKEEDQPGADNCQLNNYFLKADIAGVSWCANTSLFADYAIVMTINGIGSNGATLNFELDDVTTGTYSIKQDRNHMLYTSTLGVGYESTNDNPGSLTIIGNDTANNIINGSFNATLRSPVSGNISVTNGTFKLFYTE